MSSFPKFLLLFAVMIPMALGAPGCTREASDSAGDAATSGLVINEIAAKAPDDAADWIELYNDGNETVLLSDYTIMDDNGYRERAQLPDRTLAPGEFIVIRAVDDAPEDGSYHVPFKLGDDDMLTLYKGNWIIDTLDWDEGDAPEGSSYGRFPDGGVDAMTLTPTPGDENE